MQDDMDRSAPSVAERLPKQARLLFPPLAITALLWMTRANPVSAWQGFAAFILLGISWWSYSRWREDSKGDLPLFPMVAFAYWIYFALPLFWGNRNGVGLSEGETFPDEIITRTIIMVLLGVLFLWLGMKSRIGERIAPRNPIDISPDPKHWDYLRALLIVSGLFSLNERAPYLFGNGGRQIIIIFQSTVPMVIFAILFRNYLKGRASRFDKALLVFFLAIRFLVGLSSGWLGSLAIFAVICTFVYMQERKRIPGFVIALVLVYALFFQVGKSAFREAYWYGDGQVGKLERIVFWINASLVTWESAINEPDSHELQDLAVETLSRVSLLNQAANVLEFTPSAVPYQHGRLYSYLGVTFIPRFLWPEKPSVSDANRYYQVAYGLTTEENIDKTAIGIGSLTESYINFGWIGVLLVMFTLGILFDYFHRTFLTKGSGMLLAGIGVVLLPKFLILESQLSSFLGGLVQQVLFTLLLLAPLIFIRRTKSEAEAINLSADSP